MQPKRGDLTKRAKERGISRQRMWQIDRRKMGLCFRCGAPAVTTQKNLDKPGAFCQYHLDQNNRRSQEWRDKKRAQR